MSYRLANSLRRARRNFVPEPTALRAKTLSLAPRFYRPGTDVAATYYEILSAHRGYTPLTAAEEEALMGCAIGAVVDLRGVAWERVQ